MRISLIVGGDVQLRRCSSRNARRLEGAIALQVIVGDEDCGRSDSQVVVTVTAAVCTSGGGHIDDQDPVACHEVAFQGIEKSSVGRAVERDDLRPVVGLADVQGANGRPAHRGDTAADRIRVRFIESQILARRAASLAKVKPQLNLGDINIARLQVFQVAKLDRAFIARARIDTLAGLAARPRRTARIFQLVCPT